LVLVFEELAVRRHECRNRAGVGIAFDYNEILYELTRAEKDAEARTGIAEGFAHREHLGPFEFGIILRDLYERNVRAVGKSRVSAVIDEPRAALDAESDQLFPFLATGATRCRVSGPDHENE